MPEDDEQDVQVARQPGPVVTALRRRLAEGVRSSLVARHLNRHRRAWVTALILLFLAGTCVLVGLSAYGGYSLGIPTGGTDRAAVISADVALISFLLVALGVAVALVAYLVSTGQPALEPEVGFRFSFPNEPVFKMDPNGSNTMRQILQYRQIEGRVVLKNTSRYAARNPGVRILLNGLGGFDPGINLGWKPISRVNFVGVYEVQWDGGADYLIHGEWQRLLPALNFTGVFQIIGAKRPPEIVVTVAADGFLPRDWHMPVRCLNEEEYQRYSEERAQRFGLLWSAQPADDADTREA